MSLSKKLKIKFNSFNDKQKKKIIKMSIEDKVSFSEIKKEFSLSPGEVEKFMLRELGEKRYKRWMLRRRKRSTQKGRRISKE